MFLLVIVVQLKYDNKSDKPDTDKQRTVLPLIARCRRYYTKHRRRRNLFATIERDHLLTDNRYHHHRSSCSKSI